MSGGLCCPTPPINFHLSVGEASLQMHAARSRQSAVHTELYFKFRSSSESFHGYTNTPGRATGGAHSRQLNVTLQTKKFVGLSFFLHFKDISENTALMSEPRSRCETSRCSSLTKNDSITLGAAGDNVLGKCNYKLLGVHGE